jgi:hypothetical protein
MAGDTKSGLIEGVLKSRTPLTAKTRVTVPNRRIGAPDSIVEIDVRNSPLASFDETPAPVRVAVVTAEGGGTLGLTMQEAQVLRRLLNFHMADPLAYPSA